MALHCAATFVLVPVGTPPARSRALAGVGAVVVGPLTGDADVVAELQALADLHRGERVVLPVSPAQRAAVLEHVGRSARTGGSVEEPLRLEVGDDGWAVLPAAG